MLLLSGGFFKKSHTKNTFFCLFKNSDTKNTPFSKKAVPKTSCLLFHRRKLLLKFAKSGLNNEHIH
jgi:hypothetical protein